MILCNFIFNSHLLLNIIKIFVCFFLLCFFQHRDWFLDSEFEEHWWNLSLKQKSYVCIFLLRFFHNRAFFSSAFGKNWLKSKPQTKTGCLLCFPTPRIKCTSCSSGFQFRHQVPYLEIRKRRGKGKIPQLFQSLGNLPFRFIFLEPSYIQIKSVNGQI